LVLKCIKDIYKATGVRNDEMGKSGFGLTGVEK